MDAGRSDSQRLSRVEATMVRLTGTGACELADKTVLVSVRVSSADLNLGGVEGGVKQDQQQSMHKRNLSWCLLALIHSSNNMPLIVL